MTASDNTLPPLDLAALAKAAGGDADLLYWLTQCRYPVNNPAGLASALEFWRVSVCGFFEQCREEFEAGRQEALLEAIAWAADTGAPIPQWARAPFSEGWSRYRDVVPDDPDEPGASTLGGAFGVTRPRNFNAPAARYWNQNASAVWSEITRRRQAGEKVGPEMFEAVAKEMSRDPNLNVYAMLHGLPVDSADTLLDERMQKGISAGTVKAYYYAFMGMINRREERHKKEQRKNTAPRFPDLTPAKKR